MVYYSRIQSAVSLGLNCAITGGNSHLMKHSRPIDTCHEESQLADQLIAGCRHCVKQCEQILELMDQDSYIANGVISSSIGAHMRHILDRFQCFFIGIRSGVIDYDERKRDMSIETSLEAASSELTSVSRRIDSMDLDKVLGKIIEVRELVHHESPFVEVPSTFDREIMGLISHSTHHLAIIALIAKSLGFEIDEEFGKAPSTLVSERS